jgi:hypothetical protein
MRLDVSKGGHPWVWYRVLDRRNGHLAWGPVGCPFNRRKPLHWFIALAVLFRRGDRR